MIIFLHYVMSVVLTRYSAVKFPYRNITSVGIFAPRVRKLLDFIDFVVPVP